MRTVDMQWDEEAIRILDDIPLPPVMVQFARLDAERRARRKGQDRVTAAIAKATHKGYERTFGKEAMETVRAMLRGQQVPMPDEFYEDDEGELFSIELCPAKFGACTREKREMMQQIITALRKKLKALDTTGIMMEKSTTPLMSHHMLHLAVIGCPNCCTAPYFSDFGVICTYRPGITDEECSECKVCVRCCSEGAIRLQGGRPHIDYEKCVMCGACEKACPRQVIVTNMRGYRVVVGGKGSRHPRIARQITGCTDAAGVVRILDKALSLYRQAPSEGRDLGFHTFIASVDAEALQ